MAQIRREHRLGRCSPIGRSPGHLARNYKGGSVAEAVLVWLTRITAEPSVKK